MSYVAGVRELRNAYKILVWILKGKRSFRGTRGLEDSVKMDRPIKDMLYGVIDG